MRFTLAVALLALVPALWIPPVHAACQDFAPAGTTTHRLCVLEDADDPNGCNTSWVASFERNPWAPPGGSLLGLFAGDAAASSTYGCERTRIVAAGGPLGQSVSAGGLISQKHQPRWNGTGFELWYYETTIAGAAQWGIVVGLAPGAEYHQRRFVDGTCLDAAWFNTPLGPRFVWDWDACRLPPFEPMSDLPDWPG